MRTGLKAPTRWMIVTAWLLAMIAADVFTSPFRRHFPPMPGEFLWNAGILLAALMTRRSGLLASVAAPALAGALLALTPMGWRLNSLIDGIATAFLILTLSNLPFTSALSERREPEAAMRPRAWIGIVCMVVMAIAASYAAVFDGRMGMTSIMLSALVMPLAITGMMGWTSAVVTDALAEVAIRRASRTHERVATDGEVAGSTAITEG